MKKSTDHLVAASLIAAVYTVLTLSFSPLSYGVMQIRFSEALTVLALYTPAAIPGLTAGCFLSGILGPNGIADAAVGSLATLIGALCVYRFRVLKYKTAVFNVLSNGILVGLMLSRISGVDISPAACILWVALGEAVSCFGLGSLLIRFIDTKGLQLISDMKKNSRR